MVGAKPVLPQCHREFAQDSRWGSVGSLQRVDIAFGERHEGFYGGLRGASVVSHSSRTSILLWIAGGHLLGSHEEVGKAALRSIRSTIDDYSLAPFDYFSRLVAELEREVQGGALVRASVSAAVIACVGANEVWVWHVGPNGVLLGMPDTLKFRSTDVRIPVFRSLGLLGEMQRLSDEISFVDGVSSVFHVGDQIGYEQIVVNLTTEQCLLVLDRGCLPVDIRQKEVVSLGSLLDSDAGWRRGLPAHGTLITGSRELALECSEVVPSWVLFEPIDVPDGRTDPGAR